MNDDISSYKNLVNSYVERFDILARKIWNIKQGISTKYGVDATQENIKDVRYLVFDHMFQSVDHSRLLLKFSHLHDDIFNECSPKILEEIVLKEINILSSCSILSRYRKLFFYTT